MSDSRNAIGAERHAVAAPVIRAIDQDSAHAHVAHFAEGDLLRSHGRYQSGARPGWQ
jgi:hypothetical protein